MSSPKLEDLLSGRESDTRWAPVHGEKQTKIHEILRVFDLYVIVKIPLAFVMSNLLVCSRSYMYGPCIGTTRMERWKRAKALGLNPPIEVCRFIIGFASGD